MRTQEGNNTKVCAIEGNFDDAQTAVKNIFLDEKKIKELSEKIYSVCLLIATQGQTKEMIKKDIEIGLKYFKAVTINVFVD